MKKILLCLIVVFSFSLFIPSLVQAADPRCWEKSKCISERTKYFQLLDQKPEDGFIQNAETLRACGSSKKISDTKSEQLGFCLPVGTTQTKISFGGRTNFSDIGDFIQYTYRYAIMIAGLISILVIIIAGFQWAMSGGNSSTIQTARKKIEGALMGLTIAILSYSVLNFVNPNLVNFRLPEIWLINTVELTKSEYCGTGEGEENVMLAKFETQGETLSDNEVKKRVGGPYDITADKSVCGTKYFVNNTQGQTCRGVSCEGFGTTCARIPDGSGFDQCYQGDVVITLVRGVGTQLQADWDFPWSNQEEMHGLCTNGKTFEVDTALKSNVNEQRQVKQIIFQITESGGTDGVKSLVEAECGGIGSDSFKGFYFIIEMDESWDGLDENHYIGREPSSFQAMDLGDDESWEYIKDKVKPEFFFSLKELQKKLRIDLQMTNIYDLDNRDTVVFQQAKFVRGVIYSKLGIQ